MGFDIDMAHLLAEELGVSIELVPFRFDSVSQQLKADHFDVAMSSIYMTTARLADVDVELSEPYMYVQFALAVPDRDRHRFATVKQIDEWQGVRLGIATAEEEGEYEYFVKRLKRRLPNAEIVEIRHDKDFFTGTQPGVDALVISAEAGSAWTLLYPDYTIVIPRPMTASVPLGYAVSKQSPELARFLSQWIDLKKADGSYQELYDHWILGKGAEQRGPRWSVIRNVLRWVE